MPPSKYSARHYHPFSQKLSSMPCTPLVRQKRRLPLAFGRSRSGVSTLWGLSLASEKERTPASQGICTRSEIRCTGYITSPLACPASPTIPLLFRLSSFTTVPSLLLPLIRTPTPMPTAVAGLRREGTTVFAVSVMLALSTGARAALTGWNTTGIMMKRDQSRVAASIVYESCGTPDNTFSAMHCDKGIQVGECWINARYVARLQVHGRL